MSRSIDELLNEPQGGGCGTLVVAAVKVIAAIAVVAVGIAAAAYVPFVIGDFLRSTVDYVFPSLHTPSDGAAQCLWLIGVWAIVVSGVVSGLLCVVIYNVYCWLFDAPEQECDSYWR